MKKYYVDRNTCRCHPETCCCNDYAIYYGVKRYDSIYTDKKHSTHYGEATAEEICKLLNENSELKVIREKLTKKWMYYNND